MPLNKEQLYKLYEIANGKTFRERVFSQDADIRPELTKILTKKEHFLKLFRCVAYLSDTNLIKKSGSQPDSTDKNNLVALYQGIIIGYIEDRMVSNYQKSKLRSGSSYLDQFKALSQNEETFEFQITSLLKENRNEYLLMKECITGILLTSATAVDYTEKQALQAIEELFKPNAIEEKLHTENPAPVVSNLSIFKPETTTNNDVKKESIEKLERKEITPK